MKELITATKTFKFAAAHMLSGHEGLCKNLHGHNYLLEVTVCHDNELSENDADEGMVIDFSELKSIVNNLIIDKFDHAFIFNGISDDECEKILYQVLDGFNKKIMVFHGRATAENMSKYIFEELNNYLDKNFPMINVITIKLWETDTSYVEVTL